MEQQRQETDDEIMSDTSSYFGLRWVLTKLARAKTIATAERMMIEWDLKSENGDQVTERLDW